MNNAQNLNLEWASTLLKASARESLQQEQEFLRLVDEVDGKVTPEIAGTLFKTFSAQPDYGTQERVISVLASADDRIVTIALLSELPRLLAEAEEWAHALIGEEVEYRPELLVQLVSAIPLSAKKALITVLTDSEFQDFHEMARSLALRIEGSSCM